MKTKNEETKNEKTEYELGKIYERLGELASMYTKLSDKRERGVQLAEDEVGKLSWLADSLGYYAFTYRKIMEGQK